MTANRELDREVRSWLREDGHEDADRLLSEVLDQLDTTPQRHAGWLARRFPIVNSTRIRYGIAVTKEDFFVGVQGVNHQVKQLLHFGLESQCLFVGFYRHGLFFLLFVFERLVERPGQVFLSKTRSWRHIPVALRLRHPWLRRVLAGST